MTSAEWAHLHQGGTMVQDLSDGVRLRLSGPDAVRYLNGQVTQDVRKTFSGETLPACVTNHKGQLEAWIFLTSAPDGAILLSGPGDLRDFLPARLEKYLIADDCVLEEITDQSVLLHLTGSRRENLPGLEEGEFLSPVSRFGIPGWDLWTVPARREFWMGAFPVLTIEAASVLQVIHAVPSWGSELNPGLLPPEAAVEEAAIDYHKGCYIGQEVISRIRSAGKINRRLARLEQTSGPPVPPGANLYPGEGEGGAAVCGTITRTAGHPVTSRRYALAWLKRGAGEILSVPGENGGAAAGFVVRKTLDEG